MSENVWEHDHPVGKEFPTVNGRILKIFNVIKRPGDQSLYRVAISGLTGTQVADRIEILWLIGAY